jgi:hypothetical protein
MIQMEECESMAIYSALGNVGVLLGLCLRGTTNLRAQPAGLIVLREEERRCGGNQEKS